MIDTTSDRLTQHRILRTPTQITCEYINQTETAQVATISNISGFHFERTVFPGQRLTFDAVPEAVLEVSTGSMASAIVCDRIPCLRLRAAELIGSPALSARLKEVQKR